MFSFKYRPDVCASEYKVTVPEDFERIDYCKAYYQHKLTFDCEHNALQHCIWTHSYIMYSYETPIIEIKIIEDETAKKTNIIVVLNEDCYRISTTTIRQLSRFLNKITIEYKLGYGLSYHNIKTEMFSTRMHFFYDTNFWIENFNPKYNNDTFVQLFRKTNDEMKNIAKKYAMPTVVRVS